MLIGLLWIFGIYGGAATILHIVYAWHKGRKAEGSVTYFALLTKDNGSQLEWYLRSLLFFSWVRGRTISITVFDEGSTDDTIGIVKRFAANHCTIKLRDHYGDALDDFLDAHAHDPVVIHRITYVGGDEGLPTLQW